MSHQLKPITLGMVRAIRDELGVDLLQSYKPEVQARMETDDVCVGRIIAMCGGPTDTAGDELKALKEELWRALIEFFPKRSVFDDFIEEQSTKAADAFNPWRVVFRAAGIIGHPPWDYSYRELIWAAQGAFEPHAELIAIEINKGAKRGQSIHPETVNPWHPRRPRPKRTRADAKPSTS